MKSWLTDLFNGHHKSGNRWEVAKSGNCRSLVDCRRSFQLCSHYIQSRGLDQTRVKLRHWKAGMKAWNSPHRKILAALLTNPTRMILVDGFASHMCPTAQTDWPMYPKKMGPLNQFVSRMRPMVLIVRPAPPSMMPPSLNLLEK